MIDVIIGQDRASQIADDLMHLDQNVHILLRVKRHRLDARADLTPLLCPVCAHSLLACAKPPLKARGQATSGVMVARAASISRALKAAYAARSSSISDGLG